MTAICDGNGVFLSKHATKIELEKLSVSIQKFRSGFVTLTRGLVGGGWAVCAGGHRWKNRRLLVTLDLVADRVVDSWKDGRLIRPVERWRLWRWLRPRLWLWDGHVTRWRATLTLLLQQGDKS